MDFASRLRDLPVLRTSRLTLRPMVREDALDVFAYGRLPRVSAFCTWSPHRTIEDSRAFVDFWVSGYGTDSIRDWAVVESASGWMVGTGGFASFDAASASAEIGYVLHPEVWGKGYATELVSRVVEWGFDSEDLSKIRARCAPANVASARVLEKSGFRRDGTIRKAFCKQGLHFDLHEYSILREDVLGGGWAVDSDLSDRTALENLTLHAFQYDPATGLPITDVEPSELDLVRELFQSGAVVRGHVLRLGGVVAGYVLYTNSCHLSQPGLVVWNLTIMGVHPLVQRKGWGSRLLERSIGDLAGACDLVVVLGHPGFYPRCGFQPMSRWELSFREDLPAQACMALSISDRQILPGIIGFHPVIERFFPPPV